jgi:hypothetical protein
MTDRDDLTIRDLAEPRSTGEETAEDMALTREDSSDVEAREPADQIDADSEATTSLLPADRSDRFEQRWQEVQGSFVDEPRKAVEQADTLVAELMQELASSFSETRSGLEAQWDNDGGDVSTEDLRIALTRYRSFFNRLLAA